MSPELSDFISQARQHHLSDEEIRQRLISAGWPEQDVNQALGGSSWEMSVPQPPHPAQVLGAHGHDPTQPIGVVENLSPRGFEYSIMFITLWLTAFAAVWILNDFLFGAETSVNTFPLTVLIVSVPVFLLIFFRLREAEHAHPALLKDPSRRKSIQGTQRLSFVIVLVQTIGTLYAILQPHTGSDYSISKVVISWLVSVLVFGGIFTYYWINTQRDRQ
jgi:hypothetical protein